jgi:hypothetical protein
VVAVGGEVGGATGGVVPPPEEPDVELGVEVASEGLPPPKHPVIIRAAAMAASEVMRVFIASSAFQNDPLVPDSNPGCTNFVQAERLLTAGIIFTKILAG